MIQFSSRSRVLVERLEDRDAPNSLVALLDEIFRSPNEFNQSVPFKDALAAVNSTPAEAATVGVSLTEIPMDLPPEIHRILEHPLRTEAESARHDGLADPLAATGFAISFTSAEMSSAVLTFTAISTGATKSDTRGAEPGRSRPLVRPNDPNSVAISDIGAPTRSGGAIVTRDGLDGIGNNDVPPIDDDVAHLHFRLKWVTFSLEHGTISSDPYPVTLPNGQLSVDSVRYDWQQWLDRNNDGNADPGNPADHRWPAMTIVNQPLKVTEVAFRYWFDNQYTGPLPTGASVKGIVSGNDVPAGMILTNDDPVVGTGVDEDGNQLILFHQLSSHATAFDHIAKIYDEPHATDLKIDWKVVLDWTYSGGTSKNVFYVTWTDNTLPNFGTQWPRLLYHSLVDISTVGAAGLTAASQEPAVFSRVWGKFSGRDVHRVSGPLADRGDALTYYHNYTTINAVAATLLCFTDGTCSAWARTLIDCARAQGVFVLVNPPAPTLYEISLSNALKAADAATGDLGWDGFLVKAWAFPAAPPAGFTYPYDKLPANKLAVFGPHQYLWANPPAPQVDQAANGNLPGQSEDKPASLFKDHLLVQYGGDWYDPSYGVVYPAAAGTLQQQFAVGAVAGFWRENASLMINGVATDVFEFSQQIPRGMNANQAFKLDWGSDL